MNIENVYNEISFRYYKEFLKIPTDVSAIKKIMNGDELIHKHYIFLIDKITFNKW